MVRDDEQAEEDRGWAVSSERWKRVWRPSIVGITLGLLGGGFLWGLWPSRSPKAPRDKPSEGAAIPWKPSVSGTSTSTPSPGQESAKTPTGREGWRSCIHQAQGGQIAPICSTLPQAEATALRPSLLWVAAEGAIRQGRPAEAIPFYEELLRGSSTLWTRKRLGFRYAEALFLAGKPKEASAILASSLQERSVLPAGAWLAREIERREAAAALLLAAKNEPSEAKRSSLFAALASVYPDSPLMAEAQRTWLETWSRLTSKERKRNVGVLLVWLEDALRRGDPAAPLAAWLKEAGKLKPTGKTKIHLARLDAAWAWLYGSKKQQISRLQTFVKLLPKREQAEGWFHLAILALEDKKASQAARFFRKIRTDKRLWSQRYAFAQIEEALRKGRWRPAASLVKRAWRQERQAAPRSTIAFLSALLALRQDKIALALQEIRSALQGAKKAQISPTDDPHEALWLHARILEAKKDLPPAKALYRQIFDASPLSFFGFLASLRLTALDDPPPLLSLPADSPSWFFQASDLPQTPDLPLRWLYTDGPAIPALLALEAHFLREIQARRPPSPGLLLAFARRALSLGFASAALRWLDTAFEPYLRGLRPAHTALWPIAYPSLAFWLLEPATSPRGTILSAPPPPLPPSPSASPTRLDPRLHAALFRSFFTPPPSTPPPSRPFLPSLLLPPAPAERFASSLWLRSLTETWKEQAKILSDPALASVSLPPFRPASFSSSGDLDLLLLPSLARERFRLLWLYQLFHLR